MYTSSAPMTVTYSELDRIFFERIRLSVVALGLLPDIALYLNDLSGYNAAKSAIIASGKTVAEIFGPSVAEAKDEKTGDKIVITRTNKRKGTWSGGDTYFYELNPAEEDYTKKKYPDTNYSVFYDIRVITKTNYSDKLLSSVMDNCLPGLNFVSTIDEDGNQTEKKVLVRYKADFTYQSKYFIERSYQYAIEDVWLTTPVVVDNRVTKLLSVLCTVKNLAEGNTILDEQSVPLVSSFNEDFNNDFAI